MPRHAMLAILTPAILAMLAAARPAVAANQLNILQPTQNQIFLPGDTITVQARPSPGVTVPTLQVIWQVQCLSCGYPPTWASVFTQPDLTMPPQGDTDLTLALSGALGKFRVRVNLYPDQPGWTWSAWTNFSMQQKLRVPLVPVPSVQKNPYPKIPNPGPENPGPENVPIPTPQEQTQGH